MQLRMVDLFCGAGGCSVGYYRAAAALGIELEVVGVDHVAMPDYPFEFVRGDAMTFPLDGFDFIHASPPCKRFTPLRHTASTALFDVHDDLLTPTLERLRAQPAPWIVENVPGAPMPGAVTVCGSAFGLRVRRHRLFLSSAPLVGTVCRHAEQGSPVGVYGTGGAWRRDNNPGGGGVKVSGQDAADALGIDWTARQVVLSQAIPPAYTEYLGAQLFG